MCLSGQHPVHPCSVSGAGPPPQLSSQTCVLCTGRQYDPDNAPLAWQETECGLSLPSDGPAAPCPPLRCVHTQLRSQEWPASSTAVLSDSPSRGPNWCWLTIKCYPGNSLSGSASETQRNPFVRGHAYSNPQVCVALAQKRASGHPGGGQALWSSQQEAPKAQAVGTPWGSSLLPAAPGTQMQ